MFLLLALPVSLGVDAFGAVANLFAEDVEASVPVSTHETSPLSISLLSTAQNPAPAGTGGGDITYSAEDGVLRSTGPVPPEEIAAVSRTRPGEISVYTVRSGDTLSQIAEMYGVTINTIRWANDMSRSATVREGQTLVILPTAGVQHIVKSGESLSGIAKKYDGDIDEVLAYNQLATAEDLVVGEVLLIPGGTIETVSPAPARAVASNGGGSSAPVSSASAGWLAHPLPGSQRSQGIHGYNAIDFARVGLGSTVRAAAAGTVVVAKGAGWNGGYGNYVVIRHSNGVQTLYAHLNTVDVVSGQGVSQGDRLGGVGNTGRSTGIHLHFEVRGGSNPF